jgi:hypothetical protein
MKSNARILAEKVADELFCGEGRIELVRPNDSLAGEWTRDQLASAIEHSLGGSSMMGVGNGDTGLFVHGNYEAIKAAQAIVDERNELRRRFASLRQLLLPL